MDTLQQAQLNTAKDALLPSKGQSKIQSVQSTTSASINRPPFQEIILIIFERVHSFHFNLDGGSDDTTSVLDSSQRPGTRVADYELNRGRALKEWNTVISLVCGSYHNQYKWFMRMRGSLSCFDDERLRTTALSYPFDHIIPRQLPQPCPSPLPSLIFTAPGRVSPISAVGETSSRLLSRSVLSSRLFCCRGHINVKEEDGRQ